MVNKEVKNDELTRKPIRNSVKSSQQQSDHLKDDSSHMSESEQQTLYPDTKITLESKKKGSSKNVSKRRHTKPSSNTLYPDPEKIPESMETESLMNVSKSAFLLHKHSTDVRVYFNWVFISVKKIRSRQIPFKTSVNKVLSRSFLFIFCAVFLIPTIIFGMNKYWASEERSYDQVISDLLAQYDGLNPLSNKILKVALRQFVNVTQEPPSNPAIVTVLASPGLVSSAKSFCVEVSRSFTPNYIIIDQDIYGSGDDHEIKLKIEEAIESNIVKDELSAVIVDQVEKIPLNATMIFHSYCDEAYPRHKRMIYFFILTLNEDIGPDAGLEEVDSAAMRMFQEGWKHVHPDVYSSLITRLTGYVLNFRSVETTERKSF